MSEGGQARREVLDWRPAWPQGLVGQQQGHEIPLGSYPDEMLSAQSVTPRLRAVARFEPSSRAGRLTLGRTEKCVTVTAPTARTERCPAEFTQLGWVSHRAGGQGGAAMQVHESLVDLIGNTPLVRLRKVTRHLGAGHGRGSGGAGQGSVPAVLAKVEYMSPGGSVKDRIALRMVTAAEASGELKPGGTIVEPTSGNTGVGLAIVAAEKGYKCVFVCPDKVAPDKISVLHAYGAEVVVCPGTVSPDHPDSYYSVSTRLAQETPGGWKPDQYANPENPASHYHSTGPEIWAQTDGRVTHFVAGIGTGG